MKNEVEIDLESDVLPRAEFLNDVIQLASDMVDDLHLRESLKNCSPYQLKAAKQLEALLFSIAITSNDLKSELSTFVNSKYHSNRNSDLKTAIK
ncbi:hypothetical protein [Liquorilactobacillus satsumensis]|uniref:hypothetical protein n=1 Tax=Liquorilactobacillus satsumensis TaxID=259059 RepID=UPI0039E9D537